MVPTETDPGDLHDLEMEEVESVAGGFSPSMERGGWTTMTVAIVVIVVMVMI